MVSVGQLFDCLLNIGIFCGVLILLLVVIGYVAVVFGILDVNGIEVGCSRSDNTSILSACTIACSSSTFDVLIGASRILGGAMVVSDTLWLLSVVPFDEKLMILSLKGRLMSLDELDID